MGRGGKYQCSNPAHFKKQTEIGRFLVAYGYSETDFSRIHSSHLRSLVYLLAINVLILPFFKFAFQLMNKFFTNNARRRIVSRQGKNGTTKQEKFMSNPPDEKNSKTVNMISEMAKRNIAAANKDDQPKNKDKPKKNGCQKKRKTQRPVRI